MFQTPVLLIIFNRPDCTEKVIEVLRKIKPKQLFVAADGPRENVISDQKSCTKTRELINTIDWDCQLRTFYQNSNLGCKAGVSTAISWFFENVEEGIILEDDIIPDLSFFNFCKELLFKYRNDSRIMMISGFNNQNLWKEKDYSYFFAYYGGIWGWATWRQAWDRNDLQMKNWLEIKNQSILKNVLCQNEKYINYRELLLDMIFEKSIDTWDYQWGLSRISNSGLCIIPSKNMISNIGFGNDATHTFLQNSNVPKFSVFESQFPLKHNPFVVCNRDYDNLFMKSICPKETIFQKTKTKIKLLYEKIIK